MKLGVLAVFVFSLAIGMAWAGPAGEQGTAAATAAPDDIWAKYDPSIKVTSVFALSAFIEDALAQKPDVMEDNVWTRGYRDDLGIETELLWTVPSAQFDEKLSIAIAANDLPDVIPTNAVQFKLLVDSGVAMDITSLFEAYASPLTRKMQELDSQVSISQATVDGKLYALPLIYGNVDNSQLLWIRADWLKALDMEAPTTIDELVQLAEAFVNNDPDGNGQDDTLGLGVVKDLFSTGFADLNGLFEALGAYPGGWLKDSSGKLVYGDIQPEMKTALTKVAGMFEAGLIDQEFVVKDGGKVAESTTNGNLGMVFGQHWIPFWPLQDGKNRNTNADWQAFPLPSATGTPTKTMLGGSANRFYVLNSEMQNPEAAVKLLNYFIQKYSSLYSPDYELKYIGSTGTGESKIDEYWEYGVIQSWQPNENIVFWGLLKKYLETKDEQYIENSLIKQFSIDIAEYLAGENDAHWSTYAWIGPDGPYSVIDGYFKNGQTIQSAYIKANTPSMTERGAALSQLRVEMFTKIITGTESPDTFDEYVATWKRLGGDDITNEVNAVN
jgi:putative aldouronate transport system substrate-binding protein